MEERRRGRKEELQKTKERIKNRHREGQDGVTGEGMGRDYRISKSRRLPFNALEDEGTKLERKPLDSKYWH